MPINWFLALATCLNIGAAWVYYQRGSVKFAFVWLAYAIATGIQSTMVGK